MYVSTHKRRMPNTFREEEKLIEKIEGWFDAVEMLIKACHA
jgi:hypothetical protein